MKAGTTVRLIQPEIKGQVIERRFNHDAIELLVEWTDSDGQTHTRWFPETTLEAVQ